MDFARWTRRFSASLRAPFRLGEKHVWSRVRHCGRRGCSGGSLLVPVAVGSAGRRGSQGRSRRSQEGSRRSSCRSARGRSRSQVARSPAVRGARKARRGAQEEPRLQGGQAAAAARRARGRVGGRSDPRAKAHRGGAGERGGGAARGERGQGRIDPGTQRACACAGKSPRIVEPAAARGCARVCCCCRCACAGQPRAGGGAQGSRGRALRAEEAGRGDGGSGRRCQEARAGGAR